MPIIKINNHTNNNKHYYFQLFSQPVMVTLHELISGGSRLVSVWGFFGSFRSLNRLGRAASSSESRCPYTILLPR